MYIKYKGEILKFSDVCSIERTEKFIDLPVGQMYERTEISFFNKDGQLLKKWFIDELEEANEVESKILKLLGEDVIDLEQV